MTRVFLVVVLIGALPGRSTQADDSKKERDPRQTVESYLAALVAGKMEAAAALAVPNQKPASKKRAEGLKELAGKKGISLVSVHASENKGRAIALSQVVQLKKPNSDGRDKGRLLISLDKRGTDWLIRDLDLMNEDSAKERVSGFAYRYPDAKEIPGKARK